ncbi:ArsR family transcriptional regulator [Natrialbaceae archaeon A-CW1-1]
MTRCGSNDVGTLSPDDAFAVLANETRFEIVRTLWELYEPDDPANVVKFSDLYDGDTAVSFSDLYNEIGYSDTGNFNYHLEQLTDHFVRRTDDGYELTQAGFEIAQAVVAGTVRERPRIDATEIDAGCPLCDSPVVVDYDNHHLVASCSRCPGLWQNADGDDGVLFTLPLPPAGLSERTVEQTLHATLAFNLTRIRSFIGGVCPDCSSAVEQSLDICEAHAPGNRGGCPQCHRRHQIEVAEVCHLCKSVARGPITIAILAHPSVTAFYYDRGIEHRFATWETFRRAQTVEEEILETDPLSIRITVPCKGDRLRLTLDETLDVVDIVRETPGAVS